MDYKVILCGNSSVGKTCLAQVVSNKEVDPLSGPTMGSGFDYTNFTYENESLSACIWDTAGQEAYRSMIRIYFYGSDIALVCFDLTSKSSFNELADWFKLIDENCRGIRPAGIIVGNKSDLVKEREVSDEEIQKLAEEYQSDYILVSALEKQNIKELQEQIAKILYKKRTNQHWDAFRLPSDSNQQSKQSEEEQPPENAVEEGKIEENKPKEAPQVDIRKPLTDEQVPQKSRGCFC